MSKPQRSPVKPARERIKGRPAPSLVEAPEVQCPDGCKPEAPSQEPYSYPAHWLRGQQLSCVSRNDGWHFTMDFDPQPGTEVHHTDYMEAQGFQSWWYHRERGPGG